MDSDSPSTKPTGVGLDTSSKSLVNVVTGTRDMQFYPVSHSELHELSSMNAITTFCVGMATTFAGIAIGIYTSASFCDPKAIPPEGKLLQGPGFWCALCMAIAFTIAAIGSFIRAKGALDIIKRETRK